MITDDGSSLVPLLAKSIQKQGWIPFILKFPGVKNYINKKRQEFDKKTSVIDLSSSEDEEIKLFFNSFVKKYGEIGGFIHLHPVSKDFSDLSLEVGSNTFLKQVFLSAKYLYPYMKVSSKSGSRHCFFIVVSRMDGEIGMGSVDFSPISSGFSGLTKTASIEWPDIFCRFIDLHPEIDEEKSSQLILQEINDSDLRLREIGYCLSGKDKIKRMTILPKKIQKLNTRNMENLITKKSVFLVSGGGKGVTAECVIKLAEETHCNFILLGRSPLEEEPEWAKSEKDDDQLKQNAMNFIIESGEKPTPIRINQMVKQVLGIRTIRKNLRRIENAGGKAEYLSVDVTNEINLKAAISPLVKKNGAITGVIHGAGVLADKLIEKKTSEDFDAVCSTKIKGMDSILKSVDQKKLTHLLIFSSAAGFYGNAGQSDYAIANEVLNRIALLFSQKYPKCHVTSFNWGPWEGGMVTPELKKYFEDRNVEVISVQDGTDIFLEDATSMMQSNPIVLIGNSMVVPDNREEINREFKVISGISLKNSSFLRDHKIGGSPVLPLVHAMAWISNVCEQRNPGFKFITSKEFKVLNGIKFDKKLTSNYTLEVKEILSKNNNYKEFDVNVSSNFEHKIKEKNQSRLHYSAIVSLAKKTNEDPMFIDMDFKNYENIPGSSFYKDGTLFHGPKFQGIEKLLNVSDKGLILECRLKEVPDSEQGQFVSNTFNPFAVDLGFQAMLIWAKNYFQSGSLPLKIDIFENFREVPFNIKFFVAIFIQKKSDTFLKADINIIDEKGFIYCRILGAETTLSKSLNKLFLKN